MTNDSKNRASLLGGQAWTYHTKKHINISKLMRGHVGFVECCLRDHCLA